SDAAEYAPGIPKTFGTTFTYFAAELIGAFLGAILAWLVYKNHYDQETDPGTILGTFSTGPEIRSYGWNLVTQLIATFVLIFVIIMFGNTPHQLGPLAVALLVLAIGASLGGPTGYAINPARDLGPRLAHAILPIKNKGGSDWGYSWVPIVGPMIGAGSTCFASFLYFSSITPAHRLLTLISRPLLPDEGVPLNDQPIFIQSIAQGITSSREIILDHSG